MQKMPTTTYRTCTFCERKVGQECLEEHQLQCGTEMVECTNGCGRSIPRYMLRQHVEETCKNGKVLCQFCLRWFSGKAFEKHCEECYIKYGYDFLEDSPESFEDSTEPVLTCVRCSNEVPRKAMDLHLEGCVQQVAKCGFCEMNIVPSLLNKHYEVCDCIAVYCESGCGIKLQRKSLSEHNCLKIKSFCEHCKEEIDDRLIEKHQSECPKMLVSCSENCGVRIPRENLDLHLWKCEKHRVTCEYKKMGCPYEGIPANMQTHMKEDSSNHMELVKRAIVKMEFEKEGESKIETMHLTEPNRYLWKVTNITEKIKLAQNGDCPFLYSPPFYSTKHGYRFRMQVRPAQCSEHLGVYFQILPGEFGPVLDWPFMKLVKCKLFDQAKGGKDIVRSFRGYDSWYFVKPKAGKFNSAYRCFTLPHEELKSGRYIVDGAIFIEVSVE